jgi:proline dehydrogenase
MQSNKLNKIDFNNSEIAFRGKSNTDLRSSYYLFKVMNNQVMVNLGKILVNFAFAIHFPIKGILRATIYKHFVGGTSIADCKKTLDRLQKRNVGAILDYALEGEEKEEIFDATAEEVKQTIRYAHEHKNVPFSAFKPTGVGRFDLMAKVSANEILTEDETAEFERLENRIESIFKLGYELGIPVLIDAEQTWIQPMLDDLIMRLMAKYNKENAIVQNTYQMYRHDSVERIKQHHQLALDGGFRFGLKIVRGAYMEKERARAAAMGYLDPIQPDKVTTDRDFDDITCYFVKHHETIDFMVATHNEKSSLLLAELIDEYKLSRNQPGISFSQLYGMSDHITYNLAEAGYNVIKYIPYAEVRTMMPYLFRRAEENTSVKGQSSRELRLIETELKRRKSK